MTRMWMVNTKCMCNQHLLGEHKEIHQLVGSIKKGHSINGYLNNKLVEPYQILRRHDQLVEEMTARHMLHKSPLTTQDFDPEGWRTTYPIVDLHKSLNDLLDRCLLCRQRHAKQMANKSEYYDRH